MKTAKAKWLAEKQELQKELSAATRAEERYDSLRDEIENLQRDIRAMRSAKPRWPVDSEQIRSELREVQEQMETERKKWCDEINEVSRAELEEERQCQRLSQEVKDAELKAEREAASRLILQQQVDESLSLGQSYQKLHKIYQEQRRSFIAASRHVRH